MQAIAAKVPEFAGGSADLNPIHFYLAQRPW
jgi:hypothetical protein